MALFSKKKNYRKNTFEKRCRIAIKHSVVNARHFTKFVLFLKNALLRFSLVKTDMAIF